MKVFTLHLMLNNGEVILLIYHNYQIMLDNYERDGPINPFPYFNSPDA